MRGLECFAHCTLLRGYSAMSYNGRQSAKRRLVHRELVRLQIDGNFKGCSLRKVGRYLNLREGVLNVPLFVETALSMELCLVKSCRHQLQ